MGPFASIGRSVCERYESFRSSMVFLGESTVEALAMIFHPRRFRFGDAMLAFERAAYGGLPIATGIGFLLGVILAFQSAAALKMFGVEVFVADLLAITMFQELGPVITAIILAGRSGSAFAAEIGTMKVNEELDALTTMGLPPVRFLVMPRVAAAIAAMPILTIFAELAGLIGGAIVLEAMNVPNEVYWRHVCSSTTAFAVLFGLGKSCLFGLLVALIGCSCGMRTKSTSDGVGVSATSAVVGGIIAIAVTDGLLAVITYVWGIGMKIGAQ